MQSSLSSCLLARQGSRQVNFRYELLCAVDGGECAACATGSNTTRAVGKRNHSVLFISSMVVFVCCGWGILCYRCLARVCFLSLLQSFNLCCSLTAVIVAVRLRRSFCF